MSTQSGTIRTNRPDAVYKCRNCGAVFRERILDYIYGRHAPDKLPMAVMDDSPHTTHLCSPLTVGFAELIAVTYD